MANYNLNQWMKEADEEAKKYQQQIMSNNQQALDVLTNAKNNALSQLDSQQNNALYNLNTNQGTINANAENDAKQLYVNKLLALKQNEQAMNRAGLGTQGIVGSQVNSINNNYGTNLSNVLTQRASDLNNLEKEKRNTLDTYNQNRLNLANQYDTTYSNTLTSINDKAQAQYNTIYQNYLAMKQNEYAAQVEKENAERQLAYQYAALNAANSGGYGYDDYSGENSVVNPYTGTINSDTKFGTFSNGYQPNNVGGNPLSSSSYKVADLFGKGGMVGSTGVYMDNQKIWTDSHGKYYVWDGSLDKYVDITNKIMVVGTKNDKKTPMLKKK